MARKKPTYRQRIAEAYDYYRKRLEYYGNVYGISVDKELQEPNYKESRKRNWLSFTNRMWSQLDKLREQSQAIEARWETENERGIRDDYGSYSDESEYSDLTEADKADTDDFEYVRWEEALFENFMTHLYYYQFIPAIMALIQTIRGDDELKARITEELTGNGGHLKLPELKQVGYYEAGMEFASQVQDFLNATSGEQIIDEGYQPDE